MCRELDYDVGREVHTGHCTRVIIDDERDRGLVCNRVEKFEDARGGGGEEGRVVGGWEDQCIVSAGSVCFAAVLDGFADGLGSAAYDDGEVGETCSSESGAGD